jgi:hypothetical protein
VLEIFVSERISSFIMFPNKFVRNLSATLMLIWVIYQKVKGSFELLLILES